MASTVGSAISSVAPNFTSTLSSMYSTVSSSFTNVISSVGKTLNSVGGSINKFIGIDKLVTNPTVAATHTGKAVANSVIQGAYGSRHGVEGALAGMAMVLSVVQLKLLALSNPVCFLTSHPASVSPTTQKTVGEV